MKINEDGKQWSKESNFNDKKEQLKKIEENKKTKKKRKENRVKI